MRAKAWKPYKVKKSRPVQADRPPGYNRPGKPDEGLTGFIGSMAASDIEERSYRSISRQKIGLSFRTQFLPLDPPRVIYGGGGRNQRGAIEADFFGAVSGLLLAAQVDGEFAHKTAGQREADRKKDAKLNDILSQLGGGYVVRIPHYYIENQEQSDMTWRQVLAGRREFP